MVAPPDKSGLKGQWGVSDPQAPAQNTGSEQQRQEFTAAFQQEQATINGHLQYTAVNAEASANAGLASRRDALYASFQAASGKIDPNDAAKAQADIDRVLGEARALSAEAATLHQETEQAKQEWEGQQAPADDAVHRIEELETWGDKQAATLRGQADAIRGHVNERRWREACTALAALLPALEPVYQEYVRQRDAKPVYEQQAAEQTARLEPLKTAERPSQPMTAQAGEAEAALQAAQAKADAKDFVAAVEAMTSVAAAVDALDAMANDTQRQQYLAATQPGAQVSELQPDRRSRPSKPTGPPSPRRPPRPSRSPPRATTPAPTRPSPRKPPGASSSRASTMCFWNKSSRTKPLWLRCSRASMRSRHSNRSTPACSRCISLWPRRRRRWRRLPKRKTSRMPSCSCRM